MLNDWLAGPGFRKDLYGQEPRAPILFFGGGQGFALSLFFFFFLINAVFTNIVIYVEFIGLNHAS